MGIPFTWRAQQTSSTAGTGTLTLNAAPANRIGFATSVGGSSQTVEYSLSVASTNQWEIGLGVFNGASPGTLTRVSVVASSNSGSLVSFSGTIDVILTFVPGQRMRGTFTGSATEVVADLGNLLTFTGSAAATRTLPAVATVPIGAGFLYVNAGTSGAVLTLDGSGSETINGATTLALFGGESVELFATATGWYATGLPPIGMVRRQTASASATLDFILPTGITNFILKFAGVVPSADGATIALRTSNDDGATYDAGASDYIVTSEATRTATSNVLSTNATASAAPLTFPLDTGSAAYSAQGETLIYIGTGSLYPELQTHSAGRDNNTSLPGEFSSVSYRTNSLAVEAVRVLPDSGTITSGTFSLYAVR